MVNQNRNKIILVTVVTLACMSIGIYTYLYKTKLPNINHSKPMAVFKDKDKLWQVVTYKSEPVTSILVTLFPKFKQVHKKVFLNYRSQFVFSDATPILLVDEPIFWNRDGNIVLMNGSIVNEGLVFLVGKKEMDSRTPLTLFELKVGVKSNIEKQRVLKNTRDQQRTSLTEKYNRKI
jgi:hypothetical protein